MTKRFVRSLTEKFPWIPTFRIVEELRLALIEFRRIYNEIWLIERHGRRSRVQFRRDQMYDVPLAS